MHLLVGQRPRATTAVSGQLGLAGFDVLLKSAVSDEKSEAAMIFLLRSPKIEKFMIKKGPEVLRRTESERFIAKNYKNKLLWVDESGKILSLQDRPFHDAKLFLKHTLKKNLSSSGVPSGLVPDIKRGFRILDGKQAASKSIKKALTELTTTNGVFGPP